MPQKVDSILSIRSESLDEVLASTFEVLYPHLKLGEAPISIHSRASDGDTPLHVMAWRSDVAGVTTLISAGADVNAVGDMGETPLHVAVRKGQKDIIERLLRAGAEADIESDFGTSARGIAERDDPVIARMIQKIEDEID